MRRLASISITLLAMLLLFASGLAIPNGVSSSTPQTLSLKTSGQVLNVASQQYFINQSGAFVSATFPGYSISSGTINYALNASVTGETITGQVSFNLNGSLSGGGTITISSTSDPLSAMIAAVCLPNYDTPSTGGGCQANDTSAVPAFFVGFARMQVTSSTGNRILSNVEMMFESAYLNPYGSPIVIASADSSIVVITAYTQATVTWSGAFEAGSINGSFGSTAISGQFSQNSTEQENLVSAIAKDSGTMTFSNVIDANGSAITSLDASGTYTGNSSIPLAGSYDCSAEIGFPAGSGVCTQTGFQSSGNFNLQSQSYSVMGNYSSTWGTPAFGYSGKANATVLPIDPPVVTPTLVNTKEITSAAGLSSTVVLVLLLFVFALQRRAKRSKEDTLIEHSPNNPKHH